MEGQFGVVATRIRETTLRGDALGAVLLVEQG